MIITYDGDGPVSDHFERKSSSGTELPAYVFNMLIQKIKQGVKRENLCKPSTWAEMSVEQLTQIDETFRETMTDKERQQWEDHERMSLGRFGKIKGLEKLPKLTK